MFLRQELLIPAPADGKTTTVDVPCAFTTVVITGLMATTRSADVSRIKAKTFRFLVNSLFIKSPKFSLYALFI